MKIFKGIILFLVIILIFWLVVAAFIPGGCKYEKSIFINAPVEKVWQNTNTLKAMDQWNDLEPNMKKDRTGITRQPGDKACWDSSNKEAGKGCQEIKKVDTAGKRIDTEIEFLTPYKSEANVYIMIVPEGIGSKSNLGIYFSDPISFYNNETIHEYGGCCRKRLSKRAFKAENHI